MSQLRLIGVCWPPQKGWIKEACLREISERTREEFESYGKLPRMPRKEEKKAIRKQKRAERRAVMAKIEAKSQFQAKLERHPSYKRDEDFYISREWRELRYLALKNTDGRCQCCGASGKDGLRIHVDHIQPRYHRPDLSLSLDNLQVLCEDCNYGKGAWDNTDWR